MSYTPDNLIKATGIEFKYLNSTGVSLSKATPVKIDSIGNLDFVNVSIEADVFALGGVTGELIPDGIRGKIAKSGRIEDITTTASFGDPVYISKTGDLTNIKPSTGVNSFVAGDFIVRVGTIAKNENNPLLKDLILEMTIVGQLG